MKKVLLLMLGLVLAGCVTVPALAPTNSFAQGLVALPEEGRILIMTLVTFGVSWLLLKINMGKLTEPIVAILAPIIITALESVLGTIPPVFDNLVLAIIHVLVLGVGALGSYVLFMRAREPQGLYSGSVG